MTKLDYQRNEYSRLSNMMLQGEENDLYPEKGDGDSYRRISDESVVLKMDLEELKEIHKRLRLELESTLKDNNDLSQKVRKYRFNIILF